MRRCALALAVLVGIGLGGCARPYLAAPNPTVRTVPAEPWPGWENEVVATEEPAPPPASEEKPSLWQRADVRAAELRDQAAEINRKVLDRVEKVTNSDLVVTTATVVAVPFFFIAPRSGR